MGATIESPKPRRRLFHSLRSRINISRRLLSRISKRPTGLRIWGFYPTSAIGTIVPRSVQACLDDCCTFDCTFDKCWYWKPTNLVRRMHLLKVLFHYFSCPYISMLRVVHAMVHISKDDSVPWSGHNITPTV